MKKIIKWFKELYELMMEQCPHCGYYCTGKSAFCTKYYEKDNK